MIHEIEELLQHWGAACRKGGVGGSGGGCSILGIAMQYGGIMPGRSSVGGGMASTVDMVAEEVDAALAEIGRIPGCTDLVHLARIRYLLTPALLVEQQMKRLHIASERTYHSRVARLHDKLKDRLAMREQGRRARG